MRLAGTEATHHLDEGSLMKLGTGTRWSIGLSNLDIATVLNTQYLERAPMSTFSSL